MDKWLFNADKLEDICVEETSPTGPSISRPTESAISNRSIQNRGRTFSKLLDDDSIAKEAESIVV
jgi:hypothetical protein